jgi:pimeloyl-ACP methyl ester carboxylesterase
MSLSTQDDWRAGGNYTQLSDGVTHWRREGPADGVPMVLVHGATVPCWEFDPLVPLLSAAGFQTLRFDLYGHGSSDRPPGDYNLERFMRQTIEVVEATEFPGPTIFLGHSFGAAIVAAVAAARPECVAGLVLVAPMLDFNASNRWAKVLGFPGVGKLAMRFFGAPALIRRRRRRYEHIGQSHLTQRFIEQVADGGFARGLSSMIRTAALGDQSSRYLALRDIDPRVLVIAGEDDTIIPAEDVARVRSLLPLHSHASITRAEHNILLTHADTVAATLVKWLADASQ